DLARRESESGGETVFEGSDLDVHALGLIEQGLNTRLTGMARADFGMQLLADVRELQDQLIPPGPEADGGGHERARAEQPEHADHAGDVRRIVTADEEALPRAIQIRRGRLQLETRNAVAEGHGQLVTEVPVFDRAAAMAVLAQLGDGLALGLGPAALAVDIS